jgi:hypothetical protein
MVRTFFHVDMDAFFVSVEELYDLASLSADGFSVYRKPHDAAPSPSRAENT